MHKRTFKRTIAVFLALCMCFSCLPAAFAEGRVVQTNSRTEAAEQTLEDAAVQLGAYTPPAEPEQAEESAGEAAAPAEPTQAPIEREEEPVHLTQPPAEPDQLPRRDGPLVREPVAYDDLDGRLSADEMTMTATRLRGGETEAVEYILIGCWQQLVALDTYPETQTATSSASATELTEDQRPNVMGPIWRIHETRSGFGASWTESERELVYPGDANLVGAFANYTLYGLNADTTHPNGKIVDPNGGTANGHYLGETVTTDENGWGTDIGRDRYVGGTLTEPTGVTFYNYPKYSLTGDYVIFRNIYMEDANRNWDPLMFYGTMLGVKGNAIDSSVVADSRKSPLVNAVNKIYLCAHSDDYADLIGQPVISHVTVNQTAKLRTTKYTGVGFFATISSARPGATSLVNSNVKAEVRNLKFTDISVDNSAEGMELETTVVSSLTGFLGGGLGIVLDAILTVLLGKKTHFDDSLNALLDARRKDPTNMATGAFAGKVDGDVLIENCDLVNVTLSSDYAYVGGFVGYSSGIVQYDGLSAGLDAVLKILTNLLNVIPGLGLGDLVSIVKQVLPLNNLIPVGYYNPYILDCDVKNLHGPNNAPIGSMTYAWEGDTAGVTIQKDTEYVGGFIGCKIATVMTNDSISDSTYSLQGTRYVGGFAGMARDAVIQELLTDLGVNLGLMKEITERLADANVNLQSVQVRCNLNNDTITVNGTEYLGGFNGAMCNAYCINNEVNCPGNTLTVNGTGDHVGGFAGLATLGYPMSLGSTTEEESLLSTLNKVVTSLASSYGNSLLNLMGVGQSEILGLQFDFGQVGGSGDEVSITGHDFVGGLVGKADALIMGGATEENLEKITYIQDGDLTVKDLFPDTTGGSSLTVSYLTPEGVPTPSSADRQFGETVTLPADPGSAPSGYTFVGWVTRDYHNTDAEPAKIYAPNVTYVVTRDVTFRALYQKPGEFVFVLMTEAAAALDAEDASQNLYHDYVITYGTYYNKAEEAPEALHLRLLTGLAEDDASYQSVASGGATTIEGTAQNEEDRVVWNNGVLSNVPDKYVFTLDAQSGTNMFSIKNRQYSTYLRVNVLGVGILTANSAYLDGSCKWELVYNPTAINTTIKSDTLGAKGYLGYNTAGYFQVAPAGQTEDTETLKIKDIYLWRKMLDGPYYDTFTIGSGAAIDVSGTVYDNINIRGLKDLSGNKFVGGLVGYADTASVGSLLGDTVGIAKYARFEFSNLIVDRNEQSPHAAASAPWGVSTGLTVTASDAYAAGGIGMAVGGNVRHVDLQTLVQVAGKNCVGGFAGCVGPGQLVGTGGLDVALFGVSLINANNLLSLADGLETTLEDVAVTGIPAGYTVEATGTNVGSEQVVFCAGGFFGRANSAVVTDCHADRVRWVKANDDGRAGGFLGISQVGGLADLAGSSGEGISALGGEGSLVQADSLLGAVGYLIPSYTNVDVRFVNDSYVQGGYAGGFAADFESGTVDNSAKDEDDWYAVYNIDRILGSLYAGGFGGKVYSGALADAGGGLSVLGGMSDSLNIDVTQLLKLVNYYIPKILCAGVKSDLNTKLSGGPGTAADSHNGFVVEATSSSESDSRSGAAGGFIGCASGAEISYCDVTLLRHTEVTPPDELEAAEADSYYDADLSSYAVTATRFAGGYIAYMDVGSTASLGQGVQVLGSSLSLDDVIDALNIVSTTIAHSDVYGAPGGFAVLAADTASSGSTSYDVGRAGGFAGWIRGGQIQDSDCKRFSYIIGQIAAGGYAGEIEPGSIADALGSTSFLNGLLCAENALSLGQEFVPTIRNSETTCIPCGGAVRADAPSDAAALRGMAGGYVGHNCGGQIWGDSTAAWKDEYDHSAANQDAYGAVISYAYTGPTKPCAAVRILSVYGREYAGGFTGLMDAGSTAGSGNFSLLFDLLSVKDLLSALKVSYPTEENTAVYGPLYGVDKQLWNKWVTYVGQYGGYGMGMELLPVDAETGEVTTSDEDYEAMLADYCYGYHVAAGRTAYENRVNLVESGCAGGYVGAMISGTVTNGQAHNAKQVTAMRNAGGFAGYLKTGSAADLGQLEIAGLELNLDSLLSSAGDVFVPVIKSSSVEGYQSGMTVLAFGSAANACGNAGGYVGNARGAQIWGKYKQDETNPNAPLVGDWCRVQNLKQVQGARYVGGFIGLLGSGAVAEAGTDVSETGPLQDLLDAVVDSTASGGSSTLLTTMSATVSTVRYAQIDVADPAWGYTVGGWTETHEVAGEPVSVRQTPLAAGGFVGCMEGAIVGNNKEKNDTTSNLIVRNLRGVEGQYYAGGFVGVASSGSALSAASNRANLLSLINLGQVSALDMFRPYLFNADVQGVEEGFTTRAFASEAEGVMASRRVSGCAGGFAGAVLNGTVERSAVRALNSVKALNYAGGFVGFTGKSGVVDADQISTAGALSNLLNAQAGIGDVIGTTVSSTSVTGVSNGYTVEAGHYAKPARETTAQQPIAGGFVGYGDLAQIANSTAVNLKYVKSDEVAGGFIGQTSLAYLVEGEVGGYLTNLIVAVVNALLNRVLELDELSNANLGTVNVLGLLDLQLLTDGDLVYLDLLGLKIGVSFADVKDGDQQVAVHIGDSTVSLNLNEGQVAPTDDSFSNVTIQLFRTNHTNVDDCSVTGVAEGFDVFGGGADQTTLATAAKGPAGGFAGCNVESILEDCAVIACDVIRGTAGQIGPFSGETISSSVYENYDSSHLEGVGNTFEKTENNATQTVTYRPTNRFANLKETANLIRTDGEVEKIILMKDTALPANLQTTVPETADMQNPCSTDVELTLHKIWEDMDGTLADRADPENGETVSVVFVISQTAWTRTEGGAFVPGATTVYRTVTLTKDDASAWTGNVWTRKLTAPASDQRSGVWYSYAVTEAATEVQGAPTQTLYISGTEYADCDVTQKLNFRYTADSGYVARITNQAPMEQTVVVDFGLPVQISVVDYLKKYSAIANRNFRVMGILPVEDLNRVSRFSTVFTEDAQTTNAVSACLVVERDAATGNPKPVAPGESVNARFGSFDLPAVEEGETLTRLRYVPGSMLFDKPVQIAVALLGEDDAYCFTKVTVVPATTIYYEEDFVTFSSDWQDAGTGGSGEQNEDRPGADVLDLDSIYGYDSQYANGTTYSLEKAKKVTVSRGQNPTATFTFKGTGFDILAVTDKTTGYMTVELYKGDGLDGTMLARWGVDTFYGCSRAADGYLRYLCVWDGTAKVWRVAKTACALTDEEVAAKIGTEEDGCVVKADYPSDTATNHTPFIVYKKNYVWTTNAENSTLYQIPVISTRGFLLNNEPLPYGTYTVVLKPQYAAFFDHDKTNASYDLFLDGVRIYGPAENLDAAYYLQDHEGWPQFLEMRKLLLGQENGFGQTQEDLQMGVYIDGMNEMGKLSDFAQYGPNNEIYLDPGQAIAFTLQKGASTKIDQIHVSVKQVFSGESHVVFTSGEADAPRQTELTLQTASECYYNLSSVITWNEDNETGLIVISNPLTETGTISLRTMKVTYLEAVTDPNELVHVKVLGREAGSSALQLLNRSAALPILLDEDPVFLGAGVSLESDFSLHFYVPEAELAGKTNPYVIFTRQTADGPVVVSEYDYVEELVGDTPCRRYTFRRLPASEMGTEVSARLFYNEQGVDHMSNALPYSVKQYAMNVLAKTDDDSLKTLLVDMLNYGAEAQQYFGVRTDSLVNADLSEAQRAYATAAEPALENQKTLILRDGASVWFEGCSLSLEQNVTINYYLDLSACGLPANELLLELSWQEADGSQSTAVIDGADFASRQDGDRTLYVAVLDKLNAAQMRTVVSAVVRTKADQRCISDTMRYSIESYAQSKLRKEPTLEALLLAMMKYGDAAEAYFSIHLGEEEPG